MVGLTDPFINFHPNLERMFILNQSNSTTESDLNKENDKTTNSTVEKKSAGLMQVF